MKQSFRNEFNKFCYSTKADPRALLFIIANLFLYTIGIAAGWIDTSVFGWAVIALILLLLAAERFLNKRITRCFYIFPFCKRNYIYQCRMKKSRRQEPMICQDVLNYEVNNLMSLLPQGHFAALTHEFLIVKLLGDESIIILRCDEAYEKDLRSIQNNMYGCKKCPQHKKKNCRLRKKGCKVRPFYYIEFEKREEQSNTTR